MARRSERDLSLSDAEHLGGGLPIGVRLRVGIELLRSVAAGPAAEVLVHPRAASSRLRFERVTVSPSDTVGATGPGDASGAALLLWEILAGRPLDAGPPTRLHDIVDDMPADVDDLVMGAVRPGAPPLTATDLLDELARAAEPYAVARQGLWNLLPRGGPASRAGGAGPASTKPPRSRRGAPASARVAPAAPAKAPTLPPAKAAKRASVRPAAPVAARGAGPGPRRTSATLPSMKAVVPPAPVARPAVPTVVVAVRPPRPGLLLIHAGEEGQSLAQSLRVAGYPVVLCRDAASGLAHAIAENPVCIVCDAELPDARGEDVVRRLREQRGAVADALFVLLAPEGDSRGRAGADVWVAKPIRMGALIHQIDALVDMSSRLRSMDHALPPAPPVAGAAALTGDIRQVGIAAMLTILEMERRTGSFVATSATGAGDRAPMGRATLSEIDMNDGLELDIARGCVAGASAMGVPTRPVEVVRAMMRLGAGRFTFKPRKARHVDAPTLREVLSEAARLEDEAAAGRS